MTNQHRQYKAVFHMPYRCTDYVGIRSLRKSDSGMLTQQMMLQIFHMPITLTFLYSYSTTCDNAFK